MRPRRDRALRAPSVFVDHYRILSKHVSRPKAAWLAARWAWFMITYGEPISDDEALLAAVVIFGCAAIFLAYQGLMLAKGR